MVPHALEMALRWASRNSITSKAFHHWAERGREESREGHLSLGLVQRHQVGQHILWTVPAGCPVVVFQRQEAALALDQPLTPATGRA